MSGMMPQFPQKRKDFSEGIFFVGGSRSQTSGIERSPRNLTAAVPNYVKRAFVSRHGESRRSR